MKKTVPFLLSCAVLTILMVGCNKQNSSQGLIKYTLSKGQCVPSASGNNFTICFDSIRIDCRCPIGVTCFWAGYAEADFSFHQNGVVTPFSLTTRDFPGYTPDTIISQIKISLKDVVPYPNFTTPSPAPTQALIEVTE